MGRAGKESAKFLAHFVTPDLALSPGRLELSCRPLFALQEASLGASRYV
jgi:hypothetical protein